MSSSPEKHFSNIATGEMFVVTASEILAVRRWISGITWEPKAKHPSGQSRAETWWLAGIKKMIPPSAGEAYLAGFLGSAKKDSDEGIAMTILCGREADAGHPYPAAWGDGTGVSTEHMSEAHTIVAECIGAATKKAEDLGSRDLWAGIAAGIVLGRARAIGDEGKLVLAHAVVSIFCDGLKDAAHAGG